MQVCEVGEIMWCGPGKYWNNDASNMTRLRSLGKKRMTVKKDADGFALTFIIWSPKTYMIPFSALTLLVAHQEEHPACKDRVMRCWHGCLSGATCKWFVPEKRLLNETYMYMPVFEMQICTNVDFCRLLVEIKYVEANSNVVYHL